MRPIDIEIEPMLNMHQSDFSGTVVVVADQKRGKPEKHDFFMLA